LQQFTSFDKSEQGRRDDLPSRHDQEERNGIICKWAITYDKQLGSRICIRLPFRRSVAIAEDPLMTPGYWIVPLELFNFVVRALIAAALTPELFTDMLLMNVVIAVANPLVPAVDVMDDIMPPPIMPPIPVMEI
jgi:hypothetical protein